jgi:hypothetical protein
MRTLSSAELTSVSGGFDPDGLNPWVKLGEVIVRAASRYGGGLTSHGADLLAGAAAGQLLADYMEDRKQARIEEDERLHKIEIQKEIDARHSRSEYHTEFVAKTVHGIPFQSVLRFADGTTYIDDNLDGLYDRRE